MPVPTSRDFVASPSGDGSRACQFTGTLARSSRDDKSVRDRKISKTRASTSKYLKSNQLPVTFDDDADVLFGRSSVYIDSDGRQRLCFSLARSGHGQMTHYDSSNINYADDGSTVYFKCSSFIKRSTVDGHAKCYVTKRVIRRIGYTPLGERERDMAIVSRSLSIVYMCMYV